MSAGSSSGSWGGARGAADIIDLDRYMRGGVRPQLRAHPDIDANSSERLVVDAGGMGAGMGGGVAAAERGGSAAALGALGALAAAGATGAVAATRKNSASTCSAPRDKRYSHDSGLSDGSYVRRRTHRRVVGESAALRAHRERERERELARAATSTNSMRTFRVACERALRDQQEQIARVAQLCERLTVRGCGRGEGGRSDSATPDSSDDTSTSHSRSGRPDTRRDKTRTDECKTYKIIMTKLDELGRLFAARARAGAGAAAAGGGVGVGGATVGGVGGATGRRPRVPAPAAPAAPSTRSAGSVSVSDKLVSTETPPHRSHALARPSRRECSATRRVQVAAYAVTTECRGTGTPSTPLSGPPPLRRATPRLVERAVGGGARAPPRLVEARAHALDIAPRDAAPPQRPRTLPRRSGCLNVATESVIECESSDHTMSSAHAPHCQFDLDDPMHLYTQAKRLQALHATTRRRARSVDCSRATTPPRHTHAHAHYSSYKQEAACTSLCSRCRGYWRALTALANNIFCRNEAPT